MIRLLRVRMALLAVDRGMSTVDYSIVSDYIQPGLGGWPPQQRTGLPAL